jgi:hypothetical protein
MLRTCSCARAAELVMAIRQAVAIFLFIIAVAFVVVCWSMH